MNQDSKLKLQAHFDHELSAKESAEIALWLDRDAEARNLFTELTDLRKVLAAGELECKVPESREFYWSKIQRAIRDSDQPQPVSESAPGYSWWMRLVAPALGVAVLLMTALSLVKLTNNSSRLTHLHQIETPLEDTSAISFHSQSAGMTVVWVQTDVY